MGRGTNRVRAPLPENGAAVLCVRRRSLGRGPPSTPVCQPNYRKENDISPNLEQRWIAVIPQERLEERTDSAVFVEDVIDVPHVLDKGWQKRGFL